jgi:hypothetical protein
MGSFKLNAKSCIMNLLNNDLIGNICKLSFIEITITVELSGMKSWLNVHASPFVQFPLLKWTHFYFLYEDDVIFVIIFLRATFFRFFFFILLVFRSTENSESLLPTSPYSENELILISKSLKSNIKIVNSYKWV